MKSQVIKRSIVIAGHKTSVSLEEAFWRSLKDIARERGSTLSELVASIDSGRRHGNLSSAIRLFVLDHYRSAIHGERNNGESSRDLGSARHAFERMQ
jgi:predicted DNA-binding ribbon-helix-helix protein